MMRANVDRRELAELRGISPARVSGVAWVLISTLSGLVGVLLVPLFGLDPDTFTLVVLGPLPPLSSEDSAHFPSSLSVDSVSA